MNADSGGFARCVRHPSQFFTGFCSSCLAERLSNVDASERNPDGEPSSEPRSEIVEVSCRRSNVTRDTCEIRVRKTLQSLFELDDSQEANDRLVIEKADIVSKNLDAGTVPPPSSSCAAMNGSTNAHVDIKHDSLKSRNSKDKGVLFWLSSIFARKVVRGDGMNEPDKISVHEGSCCTGFVGSQIENKPNVRRYSCDAGDPSGSGKPAWELPRHSWDGSMMSKALSCSFACLEEPTGGSSRVRRCSADLPTAADLNPSTRYVESKMNNMSLSERPLPPDNNAESIGQGRQEESHQEIAVSGTCRKKSNRWSRVWDWSITSPFRDLVKRQEHVLERSLSESWRDSRKEKNVETMEADARLKSLRNGASASSSIQMHQFANRSTNAVNGGVQNFRVDWQRKRDYKFGRSHSVHYSSPGNLENGLLRFYLTPLRSSSRSTRKSRTRSSRLFAKGVLGL